MRMYTPEDWHAMTFEERDAAVAKAIITLAYKAMNADERAAYNVLTLRLDEYEATIIELAARAENEVRK